MLSGAFWQACYFALDPNTSSGYNNPERCGKISMYGNDLSDIQWIFEPGQEYDILNNKHDKGYKYLLSVKKVFVQLLRSFVKQGWVNRIDENNIIKVDKSFILQDFKDKEADLVYRVKMDGREVIFYILVELQSTVDFQMPYRLLLYMVEIWRSIVKDAGEGVEKKDFRLPVIVPMVLYNGENRWTACRSYRKYLSGHEAFGKYVLDFEYVLLDVNRYKEEELLAMSNLIAATFYIDQKQDLESLFCRIKRVVDTFKDMDRQEFQLFKNWCANIVLRGIGPEHKERFERIVRESMEGKSMVYNLEIAIKKELQKNREQGVQEGIKEGKAGLVIRLLQKRFGLVPDHIKDIVLHAEQGRLDALAEGIFDICSFEEAEKLLVM